MMHNFKQLKVWERSKNLVKEIYQATDLFPADERFGMTQQIRRCAVSVPSNIAEGSARGSEKEFGRFLRISLGSAYELETQLLIATELGFMKNEAFQKVETELGEIQRMLNTLERKIS